MKKLKRNKGNARLGDGWPKKLKPKFGKRPNLMDKFAKDQIKFSRTVKKNRPSREPSAEDKLKAAEKERDAIENERSSIASELVALRDRMTKVIIEGDAWQKAYCAQLELHRVLLQKAGWIAPGGGTLVIKNNPKMEGN